MLDVTLLTATLASLARAARALGGPVFAALRKSLQCLRTVLVTILAVSLPAGSVVTLLHDDGSYLTIAKGRPSKRGVAS